MQLPLDTMIRTYFSEKNRNDYVEKFAYKLLRRDKRLKGIHSLDLFSTTQVANFYQVSNATIHKYYKEHLAEFSRDGAKKYSIHDLSNMALKHGAFMRFSEFEFNGEIVTFSHQRGLLGFSLRAVLRFSFFLLYSSVAQELRRKMVTAEDFIRTENGITAQPHEGAVNGAEEDVMVDFDKMKRQGEKEKPQPPSLAETAKRIAKELEAVKPSAPPKEEQSQIVAQPQPPAQTPVVQVLPQAEPQPQASVVVQVITQSNRVKPRKVTMVKEVMPQKKKICTRLAKAIRNGTDKELESCILEMMQFQERSVERRAM